MMKIFAVAGSVFVLALVSSAERLPQGPPPPMQGVRQNVAGMDENHPVLMSYRKAIVEMKKLPATNPLSWQFQANMHGALNMDGANDAWRWCMHGNWYFLPWHRGYIYYFEKIVRKMSGDDGFRLPYWAWETEGQNALPAPFRQKQYNGMVNVFFDGTRVKAANSGMPLRPDDQSGSFATDWQNVRGVSQFTTSFAALSYGGLRVDKTMIPKRPVSMDHGAMESQAHDLIHDAVGDDTGNMGDPDTAARDPIFWLHHANVDRLWNRWRDIAGHINPDRVADKDWYDQEFPFYDENGKQVVVSVSKILELAE